MRKKACLFVATLGLLPSLCFGLGFRLTDADAFATGRGGAFAATADNPSAIFFNPAGITQLDGLNVRDGVYGILLKDEFDAKSGMDVDTVHKLQGVPNFYLTYHPADQPIAVGMGTYSPYGLGIKFPDDAQFRTLARQGSIAYLAANPVIAIQVSRTFSIAAGFTANYAEAELQRGISAPGDNFKFKGSGVDYGFTLGALWQPAPQHSFGISYHSWTDISFSGHTSVRLSGAQRDQIRKANADIRAQRAAFGALADAALTAKGIPLNGYPESIPEADADAELHFPQFVIAGYSFRPTPDWNFEVDADWTDWDSLNSVPLHQQGSLAVSLPFNYTSSVIWEFGATRYFSNGMHLSGGYIYSQNSVPDSQFSPGVPDSNRHVFSAGVGRSAGRVSWDIAYQLAYGPSRTIDNNSLADGRYRFLSHALTLSFGYKF